MVGNASFNLQVLNILGGGGGGLLGGAAQFAASRGGRSGPPIINVASALLPGAGQQGPSATPAEAIVAYKNAEKNEAEELARLRKDPILSREVKKFEEVVAKAETLDDVLDDPLARKVLLTSYGLGDQADYIGLVKRVLNSDPADENSDAAKLGRINPAWLDVIEDLDIQAVGVGKLKRTVTTLKVVEVYTRSEWLRRLDEKTPGVGKALSFRDLAVAFDEPVKVLGSKLARDVVLTGINVPQRIAFQSLEAQEKAIASRIDVSKFSDPEFVDKFLIRYLTQVNLQSTNGLLV